MNKRKRFERSEPDHPLTPRKLRLLLWVAELGIATTSQLTEISGMSKPATYNHLLDLYHMGLLDRTAVSRDALLPANVQHSPTAAFGVSENIHTVSKEGVKALVQAKYLEKDDLPEFPDYGPTKSYFLAHEVEVRDVRVWLEKAKRFHGHEGVSDWLTGNKAFFLRTRPDAVVSYQAGDTYRLYFIELDRGTEKGQLRWQDKTQQYAELFRSGAVEQNTGITDYRLLVITPDAKRCNVLEAIIRTHLPDTTLYDKFWITHRPTFDNADLAQACWIVPGCPDLMALLPG